MEANKIAIFGDLNLDTSVNIDQFPLEVGDTMFSIDGISDLIGGAATNVACGICALSHPVDFGAIIGTDPIGDLILDEVKDKGLQIDFIRRDWPISSRTTVLIDNQGNRQCINDQKQAFTYRYPDNEVAQISEGSTLVFTSTQNWCRHVSKKAKSLGHKVAVDIHAIVTVDEYHQDFCKYADIVILSAEALSVSKEEIIHQLWNEYDVATVVVTHGSEGATLGDRATETIISEPAIDVRPIVDKTGAGDAFTAGFLAALLEGKNNREALTYGQLFAAYTIGEKGSSNGYPSKSLMDELYLKYTQG